MDLAVLNWWMSKKSKKTQESPKSNSLLLFWVGGIAIIVLLAGFFVLANNHSADSGTNPGATGTSNGDLQKVNVRALSNGQYDKPQVTVKAGIPVEFSFTADPGAGCGAQLLIPAFNVSLVSRNGETQIATFTPTTPGQYPFHCGMNMFRGTLIVQ